MRDFWAKFNQYDLFPNRETVGTEKVAFMVVTLPPEPSPSPMTEGA